MPDTNGNTDAPTAAGQRGSASEEHAGSRRAYPGPGRRSRPETSINAPRVHVAMPFSKLVVQEPSREVAELAALVEELAEVLARTFPGPSIEDLHRRARELAARLT